MNLAGLIYLLGSWIRYANNNQSEVFCDSCIHVGTGFSSQRLGRSRNLCAYSDPITNCVGPIIYNERRNTMTYGPIDFIAIEFKTDQLTGESLPALLELVKKKIIRVIDLVIILKEQDGSYQVLEMEELAPDILAIFDPLEIDISGIIQVEDIEVIAEAMEANTTAALLLFENLWAIKFGEAVLRASGRMVMYDRIPFEVVNETLEIFAQAVV